MKTAAASATLLLSTLLTSSPGVAGQLDAVVPGRWHAFPNSRFDSVAVNSRALTVIHAWGSGIYDTQREQLVVWGGGHTDYDGNEVYTFGPLTSDAPRWTRLTDPSSPAANNVPRGADGRPVSRHTYNVLTYLPPPHDKMMSCVVGAQHSNGFGGPAVDFYDFTIDGRRGEPWSVGPNAPFNGAAGGFCIFNPLTQSVWYQPTGGSTPRLQEYRLASRSWTSYPVDVNEDRDPTAAIDTRRNLMVSVGKVSNTSTTPYSILLYDLARPADKPIRIRTTGIKTIENSRFPGFVYDPVNDQFVGWSGGTDIFTLKAPANPKTDVWVWSQLQLDAGNTVVPTTVAGLRQSGFIIGTFGRFRYVPSQQGVIVVNAGDEPVFFFKLPNGGAKLPSVSISGDPTTISVGGSTTLTWSTTNATACTASGAWSGAKATGGTEVRGPLSGSNNFILTCDNGTSGIGSGSVTVSTAQAIPAPSVDLNANPTNVDVGGGPTTLDWTSNSAASCIASGGWSGPKPISGSQNISSVTQQTSFVLTCQGTGGTGSDAVTVNIGSSSPTTGGPQLNLSSERSSVTPGGSLRLTWNSTGTNSCIASNAWSGAKPVSGAQTVSPTGPSSTYVLSCSGVGGSTQRNVTVVVTTGTAPAESPAPAPAQRRGGGGSLDLLTLALLGLLAAWRSRERLRHVLALTVAVLIVSPSVEAADVTTLILQSQSSTAQSDVPFTFGQAFKVGEVPARHLSSRIRAQ